MEFYEILWNFYPLYLYYCYMYYPNILSHLD